MVSGKGRRKLMTVACLTTTRCATGRTSNVAHAVPGGSAQTRPTGRSAGHWIGNNVMVVVRPADKQLNRVDPS